MSEDAFEGDAEFTVSVDGVQIGDVYTVTAARAAGASQELTITGDFGTGTHLVGIDFLNDAYGGVGLDRNLYLNGLSFNGITQFNKSLALYSGGTQSVSIRAPVRPGLSLLGVNLSGAEYGSPSTVGLVGTDYNLPTQAELDYYASKGLNVIRLPFLWERMQPTQDGTLNATYLAQIDAVVSYANAKGMKVDLDLHNFGNGYGNAVGTTGTPASSLDNLWSRIAAHFASNNNVLFGIMNEPMTQTAQEWATIEQSTVLAIRSAGAITQEILASGVGADSGINWASAGNAAVLASSVADPNGNLAFEVHQYFDSDSSGTATDITSVTDGPERLAGVTDWATAHGVRLFLGEFAAATDATSLSALDNTLSYMQQHNDVWQGGTYWAGGQWWSNYPFSVEPANGMDTAQMSVLTRYLANVAQSVSPSPLPALLPQTTIPATLTPSAILPATIAPAQIAPVSVDPVPITPTSADPTIASANSTDGNALSVYRFFDSGNGTQFLTSSTAERDTVLATRPDLVSEGVGIGAISSPAGDANAVAVFRFFDKENGTHFYTSSSAERDSIAAGRADLAYEGASFYEHGTPGDDDTAVYRFFDNSSGTHFYTANPAERSTILATRADLVPEGVAFYAPHG